jgi:hypothetical protein
LDRLSRIWRTEIQHVHIDTDTGQAVGREFMVPHTPYRVDGYVAGSRTIVEFLGDYWHGNPREYSSDRINHSTGKTFGLLYQETCLRLRALAYMGYQVYFVWASDVKQIYKAYREYPDQVDGALIRCLEQVHAAKRPRSGAMEDTEKEAETELLQFQSHGSPVKRLKSWPEEVLGLAPGHGSNPPIHTHSTSMVV